MFDIARGLSLQRAGLLPTGPPHPAFNNNCIFIQTFCQLHHYRRNGFTINYLKLYEYIWYTYNVVHYCINP